MALLKTAFCISADVTFPFIASATLWPLLVEAVKVVEITGTKSMTDGLTLLFRDRSMVAVYTEEFTPYVAKYLPTCNP